jgi:hypothetical protein
MYHIALIFPEYKEVGPNIEIGPPFLLIEGGLKDSVKIDCDSASHRNRIPKNRSVEEDRTGIIIFDYFVDLDLEIVNRSVKESVAGIISETIRGRRSEDRIPKIVSETTSALRNGVRIIILES